MSLAVLAIALGVIMLMGVPVTLVLARRDIMPLPARVNRWQAESVSLAVTGAILAVLSRGGSGQSPTEHDIVFAVAVTLLLTAFLCALAGAATATRQQRRGTAVTEPDTPS
ncbi:MAG TPA: hypothetical protein VMV07_12460 [Streptosporangiaceae bacterium]|nr:hypothetical protein [Streptosporangiaceae bacterium]